MSSSSVSLSSSTSLVIGFPQWAVDAAEIYIQRAVKRPVHIMEIVTKAKKMENKKEWQKQVIKVLESHPTITTQKLEGGSTLFTSILCSSQDPIQKFAKKQAQISLRTEIRDEKKLLRAARKAAKLQNSNPSEVRQSSAAIPTLTSSISTITYSQQIALEESGMDGNWDDDSQDDKESDQKHVKTDQFEVSEPLRNPIPRISSNDTIDFNSVEYSVWRMFFSSSVVNEKAFKNGYVLGDRKAAEEFPESSYFGQLLEQRDVTLSKNDGREEIFLNTHEPFCLATVGVQGAGKSHTLACVLESCLLPLPIPKGREIVRLRQPMTALVLHYEQNESSICEATGLISPSPMLERLLGTSAAVPREKMVILVSPSYYRQRLAFYGDYCNVKPLLFSWASLSADHIKKIMRIQEKDTQLYVAAMLDLLRKYQRDGLVPEFQSFLKSVEALCNIPSQASPLKQRAALLESLVAESYSNADLRGVGADIMSCVGPGTLVVADLTDPLLSSEEANGIFQVLTEKFRACQVPNGCGKLLALDEAHKFMTGISTDGLSNAIVNAARLMRHDGMRVAVSTQSPKALAPELLELVSVAVLHRFHSRDWFTYLCAKLPLAEGAFHELMALTPGTALVFASRHLVTSIGDIVATESESIKGSVGYLGQHVMKVAVRARITADRGTSKKNIRGYGKQI